MISLKKIILFVGVCIHLLSSQLDAEPIISLTSPYNNQITSKKIILFKGTVSEDTEQLFLKSGAASQKEEIKLSKDRKFYFKKILTLSDAYNLFELSAVSGEEITVMPIKVFFKSKINVTIDNKNSVSKPLINLLSPADNLITKKSKVLFKGQVFGANTLKINQIQIKLRKNGEFYHRASLLNQNDYENFVIEASSDTHNEKTKVLRRVFYQVTGDDTISIVLNKPIQNVVSTKPDILFEGEIKNATSLKINNKRVSISDTGQFSFKTRLKYKNDHNEFILVAENDKNQTSSLIRHVYFNHSGTNAVETVKHKNGKQNIDVKIPSILIENPQNNFVTYEKFVTIKGKVTHTNELYINNRSANLSKTGDFSETFELENEGKYVFNLYALGDNNLNTSSAFQLFRLSKHSSQAFLNLPAEKTAVEQKLDSKISLELAGTDIRDVINVLAEKGNLNIVTDTSLQGKVFISLENVSIGDAIDNILSSQGYTYKISDNTIIVGAQAALNTPSQLKTKVIRLNNQSPEKMMPIIKKFLTAQESIQAQEQLLVLNVDAKKIDDISALIQKLDSEKISQIILEAQILEVSKSILDNIGVSWSDTYGLGVQGTKTDQQFTYSAGLQLSTLISLLESEGKAKVLAKPRIKAIHGETATIFIGDKIPYVKLTIGATGTISESVEFVDSGINLSILPEINLFTQEIKIKIQPEVSYINGYRGANNDIPIVRTRKVDTTIYVKNGTTALIGGLFNSSESETVSGLPLMGRIPLVGRIFRSSKKENAQTELVIAITPRIMTDDFEESIPIPAIKKSS